MYTGYEPVAALEKAAMNLGFHKRRGIYRVDEQLLASEEGLCNLESVNYFSQVLRK
jgi:hypothetical protein